MGNRPLAVRLLGAGLASGLLAACSGGGTVAPAAPQTRPQATARVTFTMNWNDPSGQSLRRTPKYVPASARSVGVAVNGGTAQVLNNPATTLAIDAPVGNDTFGFVLYDAANGSGNVLSRATVTQAIVLATANTVSAVLNGVVASLAVALSNASPNAGTPATVNVNVTAKDADGNTIIGSANYSAPIMLAVNDPSSSGMLALSTTTVASPAAAPTLTYSGGALNSGLAGGPTVTVVASATGIAPASAPFTPAPTFYQFAIPVGTNKPQWIAAGSDGNMWFTESPGNAVARITPSGTVTEFPIPTAASNPQGIIGASDGNLWFTEFATNKIGKLTPAGVYTEFATLLTPPDGPNGLVDRGDGTVWYAATSGDRIGFQGITSGVSGETAVTTPNAQPFWIAAGVDNNLYFTESAPGIDKIGRTSGIFGTIGEVALTAGSTPQQIVRGADGNLWFIEAGNGGSRTGMIGRLSPSTFTVINEFAPATATAFNSGNAGIATGLDGAMWFTEPNADRIGRVTMSGIVSEFVSPVTGLGMKGIAVGPDGSLWIAETGTGGNPGRIGRFVY